MGETEKGRGRELERERWEGGARERSEELDKEKRYIISYIENE